MLITAYHVFVRLTASLVFLLPGHSRRHKCETCVYYAYAAAVSLERKSAFAREHGEHTHAVQFLSTGMRLGIHMQRVLPANNAGLFALKKKRVPLRANTLISGVNSYKGADAQETRNERCLAM